MAVYYFNSRIISRKDGKSAVASAAYRHGCKMRDDLRGITFNYSYKNEVSHTEISLPEDCPDWARERYGALVGDCPEARIDVAAVSKRLWYELDLHEEQSKNSKRAYTQVARSMTIALPQELSPSERVNLTRSFVQNSFAARGMIADWTLHDLKDNPHVHVMLSLRSLDVDGWGKKNPDWNDRALLRSWRSEWAHEANIALERAGLDERIDHRSLVDQGIELGAETYNPHVAEHAEKTGKPARIKEICAKARIKNAAYLREYPEHILTVLNAERTVFSQKHIEKAFEKRLGKSGDIAALVAKAMGSPDLVQLEKTGAGEVLYATKAHMSAEINLLVDALALHSERLVVPESLSVSASHSPVGLAGHFMLGKPAGSGATGKVVDGEPGSGLGADQLNALQSMVSDCRLSLVTGYAGAGKTRTIAQAVKIWEDRGFAVIGGAVSGKATQELSDIKGLNAASLAAWEARWSRGQVPPRGRFVFFMDEAGMVGASHWERVQRRILELGGKLVAVGDPEQLQPVLDTAAFGAVIDRLGAQTISHVRRMENSAEREATVQFAQGEAGAQAALGYYEAAGHIQYERSVAEAIGVLAEAYYSTGNPEDSRLAIGYSNADVVALNAEIRLQAIARGLVDQDAEIDYGLIRRIDRSGLHPKIEIAPMIFAPGERIIFTRPHRELEIAKSGFATIEAARVGEIDLLLDGDAGRRVTIDMTAFDHFDYGYAATTHKSQGMTVDYSFALAHGRMNRHVAYVQMSRHRKAVRMFVPERRFKDISFEEAVTRSGYLNMSAEVRADRQRGRSTPDLSGPDLAVSNFEGADFGARADYLPDNVVSHDAAFLADGHLSGVLKRVYGLLASEYVEETTAMFADDPQGYVAHPQGVIEDILAHQSYFKADDVAAKLSAVVLDPDSFARLFREAMSHPDLVVLSEEGTLGEGRIYSTKRQVALELAVLDRGVALAFGAQDQSLEISAGYRMAAMAQCDPALSLGDAVQHGCEGAQVRLITGGSGSGKTTALGVLATAHEMAGCDVIPVGATRAAAEVFGSHVGGTARSFGSLEYGLERGTIALGPNSVIVLDEAGMMGAGASSRLLSIVEASGAKLIAGFDPAQLAPVEAGAIFRALEERIGSCKLGGSLRQRSPASRAFIKELASSGGAANDLADDLIAGLPGDAVVAGSSATGSSATGSSVQCDLVCAGSRELAISVLADAYINDPAADKIALAHSRADVAALNRAIALRLDAGPSARNVPDTAPDDAPDQWAARAGIKGFAVGDAICLSEYYAPARLPAGTSGVVVAADAEGFKLRLGRANEDRFVVVGRDDVEFKAGLHFAQTLYAAKGRGCASVHMLGSRGMSRAGLYTGVGLHEYRFSLVLPVAPDAGAGFLGAVLGQDGRGSSVTDYRFDALAALAEVSDHAEALHQTRRGANTPYVMDVVDVDAANAAYLRAHPEHILTLIGIERTVFTQADIEAALKARLGSGGEAERLLEPVFAHPALVPLERFGPGGGRLYTTRAHVVTETNLVAQARAVNAAPFAGDFSVAADAISEQLDPVQRLAVGAMSDAQRITLVTGYAGAGKTAAIGEAARIWAARGYEVIGGALSGRATEELAGIGGLEAASLASWEARWERGRAPANGKFVFFMDEAGMVGSDVWARVQNRVMQMGGKLVAVGDPEQLQPISDGNAFKALEAELGAALIDKVWRQQSAQERRYTEQLARGGAQAAAAIRAYHAQGSVNFRDEVEDCIGDVAEAYFRSGDGSQSRMALAYTGRDVAALNVAIRAQALIRGLVRDSSVLNYGQIERIVRVGGVKTVETAPLMLGEGERVIFTKAHRDLGIPKSAFATVLKTRTGEFDLLLDGDEGRRVTINTGQFNAFDYGYAATVHKSQGMTQDYIFVVGHGYMDKHALYVALSRHRLAVELHVPRSRIPDLAQLEVMAGRSNYQSLAALEAPSSIPGVVLESSGRALSKDDIGSRLDRLDTPVVAEVSFEADAHLASVANRMTGLLASNYVTGDPVFGDDPKGYGQDPQKIIDDIIQHQSTLRAADVARKLSGVVLEPDSFARLFRAAMSHPDLVVLAEDGAGGEGRIYSTKHQVGLELDVMDRGVRLALQRPEDHGCYVPGLGFDTLRQVLKDRDLTEEQGDALRQGATNAQLSLISGGSGTGKTRVAAALAEAHLAEGWQVLGVAPTGIGADHLRAAGVGRVMTLAGLEHGLATGRLRLDPNTVIILDEAGQVGAKSADRLFAHIEASGAKLIALNDNDQLGPFEAAPIFRTLEARVGSVELGVGQRSRNSALAFTLSLMTHRRGNVEEMVKRLDNLGVLQAGHTRAQSIRKIAAQFVADPALDKIAIAHSRADVAALNDQIRTELDARMPERVDPSGENHPSGSIADLRPGDRIVLGSYYEAAHLRAGTRFEVARRDETGVILRMGSGDEAQFLKFESEDPAFEYRFGFATTVQGSKGCSYDSVHILATPGMSRNLLYTGAALHRQSVNIVLPTREAQKLSAARAILQTDGTARSVLDYGFDAALAARAAMQGQAVQVRETEITRGVARLRGWFGGASGQVLPHGIGAEVMAELIGGQIIESGKAPSGEVRSALSEMVTQVSDPGRWRKISRQLPGGFVEEESRLAVSKAGIGSDGQALPVARVLARGQLAAEHMGESELAARFGRGLDLYAARADEARRTMGIAALEAVQVDHLPEVAWPEVPGRAGPDAFGDRREARNTRQRRPARSLRNLFPTSEAEVARRLVGLIIPNDRYAPGFLDGFLEEWDKHSPRAAGQRGMDLSRAGLERASDSGAEIVINTGVPLGTARADAPEAGTPDAGLQLDGLAERLTAGTAQAVRPDAERRLDDLARSLTSAVSQHIAYYSEVHKRDDLHHDIRQLLAEGQRFAPGDPEQIEAAAREIAKARRINDIKRALIAEIEPNEYSKKQAIYGDEHPYEYLGEKWVKAYDEKLSDRLNAERFGSLEITDADRDIVRAARLLPENHNKAGQKLAGIIMEAAAYEDLPDAERLKADRSDILREISSTDGNAAVARKPEFAARLYRAFTHREVDALANPKAALPATLPVQPEMRGILAQMLGPVFARDNTSLKPWGDHMDNLTRERSRELERERGSGLER